MVWNRIMLCYVMLCYAVMLWKRTENNRIGYWQKSAYIIIKKSIEFIQNRLLLKSDNVMLCLE